MKNETPLSKEIFSSLSDNEYLSKLYNELLVEYARKVLQLNSAPIDSVKITDLLRFADLLSKSIDVEQKIIDEQKSWAQEIIDMLLVLYPDNSLIKSYAMSIYSSTSNFAGQSLLNSDSSGLCAMDKLYEDYKKSMLAVPYDENLFYLPAQKEAIRRFDDGAFSFSGPTSIGKSFLIKKHIQNIISKGAKNNFVILVPTRALINETSSSIINLLGEDLKKFNYTIINSSESPFITNDKNFIFVLTPERFLYLLINHSELNMDYLYVDEAHKISTPDSRSITYYKVIAKAKDLNPSIKVVFTSPNIPNPHIYTNLLEENTSADRGMQTIFSPVGHAYFLLDFNNSAFSIMNPHSKQAIDIDDDNLNGLDAYSLMQKVGKSKQIMVYCGSRKRAIDEAIRYKENYSKSDDKELLNLAKDIRSEIHNSYYLAELITHGIAYHVSYLPGWLRLRIEELFKKKKIRALFCTSTLIEGVNLPAENLFILSHRNGTSNLKDIEFKNLMGRTGRIGENLFGNIFAICDTESASQIRLKELMLADISNQELSISKIIEPGTYKLMEESFLRGDTMIDFSKKKFSGDKISAIKMAEMIILNDIKDSSDSLITREFKANTKTDNVATIQKAFSGKPIDDDINITPSQALSLADYIETNGGYPSLPDDYNKSYTVVFNFLLQISVIFNWATYEPALVKPSPDGTLRSLKLLAFVLRGWMRGETISSIIQSRIDYYASRKKKIYINHLVQNFTGSALQLNAIANSVLEYINGTVLFTATNYFHRFSKECERQNINLSGNDWYKFIEYGTRDEVVIGLQEIGFSRETAYRIIKLNDTEKLIKSSEDTPIRLYRRILELDDANIKAEINDVVLNMPEVLMDDSI